MQESSIVAYTEQVAGEIASRHADDPVAELELWLKLAHQREAMVTQLYELSELDRRLTAEQASGVCRLVRSVVLSIWAHESSHTRHLATLRSAHSASAALAELQGSLEGWVTRQATQGSGLARMLIAIGVSLGQAPDFARELRELSLVELLQFHAELETTARMGYQRILQIAARIDDELSGSTPVNGASNGASNVAGTAAGTADYGITFRYDMARILCEENFHEAAFLEMMRWLEDEGKLSELSVPACTQALHRLCAEHLAVGAVRGVAAAESPGLESFVPGDPQGNEWVSDGGLGAVFRSAGLAVPVLEGSR
ncbi:MAG: hypothetical protein RL033_6670 [Pseudomonadota bacterium]|jgi:hypothetical protein